MPTRNATAVWNGTGKEGTGNISTQSTVLKQNTVFMEKQVRRWNRYKS